jgi:hypothetical protein
VVIVQPLIVICLQGLLLVVLRQIASSPVSMVQSSTWTRWLESMSMPSLLARPTERMRMCETVTSEH